MVRFRQFAALTAALLYSASPLLAQPPSGRGGGRNRVMRERWRSMSSPDRMRFRANAQRWRELPMEQRRALRQQDVARRERLRNDAEAAMRASGLQLEAEKRAQFEQRYVEERKRVERSLRQELREKRQREMAPVVEQLKKEFAAPDHAKQSPALENSTPATTSAPGASPAK